MTKKKTPPTYKQSYAYIPEAMRVITNGKITGVVRKKLNNGVEFLGLVLKFTNDKDDSDFYFKTVIEKRGALIGRVMKDVSYEIATLAQAKDELIKDLDLQEQFYGDTGYYVGLLTQEQSVRSYAKQGDTADWRRKYIESLEIPIVK